MNKTFRYKKRFSYITRDQLFSFDLTVVKASNKKTKTNQPTKHRIESKQNKRRNETQ